RGFSATDHIPSRRDQMHPIAERGHSLQAMRIVGYQRKSSRGPAAAHHPVIAPDRSLPLAQLYGRRRRGPGVELGSGLLIAPVVSGQLVGREVNRRVEWVVKMQNLSP